MTTRIRHLGTLFALLLAGVSFLQADPLPERAASVVDYDIRVLR